MSEKRYKLEQESLDLYSEVESEDSLSQIHPSHLLGFQASAILKDIPSLENLPNDDIFHRQLQKNLDVIGYAHFIYSNIDELLELKGLTEQKKFIILDSSEQFYNQLRTVHTEAVENWLYLCHWINCNTTIPNYRVEVDEYEWSQLLIHVIFEQNLDPTEYGYNSDNGLPCETPDGDVYFGDAEDWYFDADPTLLDEVSVDPLFIDAAADFFQDQMQEINLMYRHAVKLVNYFAEVQYMHWAKNNDGSWIEKHNIEDTETENEEMWVYMKPRFDPKLEWRHTFFSRRFRYRVFGEYENKLKVRDGEDVNWMHIAISLEQAKRLVKGIEPYLPYIQSLTAEKKSISLSTAEIEEWVDWFKTRTEWYEAYLHVNAWYADQSFAPSDAVTYPWWQKLESLMGKVDRKPVDYEMVKADQMLVAIKGNRIQDKTLQTETEVLTRYKEMCSEIEPELEKYGWEIKLIRQEDKKLLELAWRTPERQRLSLAISNRNKLMHARDSAPVISDENLTVGEKMRALLAQRNNQQHWREDAGLRNKAILDEELRKYADHPKFHDWVGLLEALDEDGNGTGKCTRFDVGFQLVQKEKATDAAYRNAGMRFVSQKHDLEPVEHFTEVTLKAALKEELKDQFKRREISEPEMERVLWALKSCQTDGDLLAVFFDACDKIGCANEEILSSFNRALFEVGKKKATNRTLYNAKHVAVKIMEDESLRNLVPKPRGLNPKYRKK